MLIENRAACQHVVALFIFAHCQGLQRCREPIAFLLTYLFAGVCQLERSVSKNATMDVSLAHAYENAAC